jgi:hypothetical protein
MKLDTFARPLTGAITFSVSTAMTSIVALAACGGAANLVSLSSVVGPPSITATESSTDQALELVRKRREEASGSCPAGFVRSGGNCVPAGQAAAAQPVVAAAPPPAAAAPAPQVTTTTTTGPAPAAAAQPRPQRSVPPRRVASTGQPAPQQMAAAPSQGYSGGSLKDDGHYPQVPGIVRATGVWLEGYYDYEKQDNLNPRGAPDNNPTRRAVSGGMISGVDVSQFQLGSTISGFQIGGFGGYNSTRVKFTDTTVRGRGDDNASTQIDTFSNQRQEMEGAFAGIYGSFVHGPVSADVTFKVDFFDFEQRFDQRRFFSDECAPPNITITDTRFRGSTSLTNYVVATNANYRIPVSAAFYIEPTVGLRYTHSDFGSGALALGVRDGDVFRVQGGLRFGTRFTTPDGWVWNTSLTGLLYSDVSVNGFTVPGGVGQPAFPLVSEGKLRAMGVLSSRVDVGNGYSLYGDVEVRGGDDLFGFGSRLGVRYQW